MVAKYLIIKSPSGIRFNDRFEAKYLIIKSPSGIRFNDWLVAKYLIITDLSNFFKKTLLYVKVFFCRFNNLFEKLRAVLNINKNFLLTTNVYNYLPT